MDYEKLLKIDSELKSLEKNKNYFDLESKILNVFSKDYNQEELNNLSLLNNQINDYITFIYNSGDMFFSDIILKRVSNLKNKIYQKTHELIEYKKNLPIFNELVIDLKKYAYALDFVLYNDDKDLEKYQRNIAIISEIKKSVNEIYIESKDNLDKGNKYLSDKLVGYTKLLNEFIDNELNNRINDLNLYQNRLKLSKPLSKEQKIYREELNNSIDDCINLLSKNINNVD